MTFGYYCQMPHTSSKFPTLPVVRRNSAVSDIYIVVLASIIELWESMGDEEFGNSISKQSIICTVL